MAKQKFPQEKLYNLQSNENNILFINVFVCVFVWVDLVPPRPREGGTCDKKVGFFSIIVCTYVLQEYSLFLEIVCVREENVFIEEVQLL